jgi:hypothetical protein
MGPGFLPQIAQEREVAISLETFLLDHESAKGPSGLS